MAVRKSARQRQMEGNPGKRALPEPTVAPQGALGDPQELGATGKAELARITPLIEALGELSPLYKVCLEDRCRCFERVVTLEQLIWASPVIEGRNRGGGVVKHPLFTELKGYRTALQKYDEMLGLAPAPRGRMAPAPIEDDDDPLGVLDK